MLLPSIGFSAPQHGLAMHGDLKYPADFTHFSYTNPDAPKGGSIKLWAMGTFDSFNDFIIKGTQADGLKLLYDSLLSKAQDEPFSLYGLIAESADMPHSREWVTFTLRPEARFSDGKPLRAADVKFTFDILLTQGSPFYRAYLGDIERIEIANPLELTFHFKKANHELPLIIGEIPILPAHYWQDRDFANPSLDVPLGSGPYLLASYEPGRSITYQRNKSYWAKDLPVNRGRYNFDQIRYDYYRDQTVSLEAFKAGEYDFRQEYTSKQWATSYKGPQFDSGAIQTQEIPHTRPTGMQAFIFNTRKAMFADPRVRQALAYAFDFEWTNANLFYGAYNRTHSFFSNSDMAATELPTEQELTLLEPWRDQLPPQVFNQVYHAPTYTQPGQLRKALRQALNLLKEAGWELKQGQLINTTSGQPMVFEILIAQKGMERIIAPMLKNLQRLGIKANIRIVDASQYISRLRAFDFDMIISTFPQSASPGNEQREFWGSANADQPGSRNLIGIKNPAIDALIEKVIEAPSRDALVTATRALDRVLQWHHYVIPQYHNRIYRIAYRNIFGFPEQRPTYGLGFDTWWIKPEKD